MGTKLEILRASHIGVCVSDLERSLSFYRDLLGFEEQETLEVTGDLASTLLGLDGVDLRAVYLLRDGITLELLAYAQPGSPATPPSRRMNDLGFTHLSLQVPEPAAALATLLDAGVAVMEESIVRVQDFVAAFLFRDPDGLVLEITAARRGD